MAGQPIERWSELLPLRVGNDGQPVENDLNYLAVWREKNGRWRFPAWQSCKTPPALAVPATK